MDGSPTPRSEMCAKIARWANTNPELWKARPVKGDVAIVFVPESELFNFVQNGNTSYYSESARGAYMALFDSGLQPDFVHLDHIAEYPVVYLPFPVMLKQRSARRLREYVEQGGALISEGCPGYFGDGGKVGTKQPNLGLDQVFGAREADVEFMPDLANDLRFRLDDRQVRGRLYRQVYRTEGGRAVGYYADNSIAVVEHRLGKGRTLLVGTFPGAAYFRHPDGQSREAFSAIPGWAGRQPNLRCSEPQVIARLHNGNGGTYLWVLNPARSARTARVTLSDAWGPFRRGSMVWGEDAAKVDGRIVEVKVGERNAAVIRLM